jgi:predicted ester cyclase
MDLSKMKNYVSRYYDVYSTGDLNEFNEICADPNKEINAYSEYAQAFSDMKITASNLVAEGNQVISQWEASGTHINTFLGKEATHKIMTMSGFDVFQFKEGKIASIEAQIDWVKVAKQFGLERFSELPLY